MSKYYLKATYTECRAPRVTLNSNEKGETIIYDNKPDVVWAGLVMRSRLEKQGYRNVEVKIVREAPEYAVDS